MTYVARIFYENNNKAVKCVNVFSLRYGLLYDSMLSLSLSLAEREEKTKQRDLQEIRIESHELG